MLLTLEFHNVNVIVVIEKQQPTVFETVDKVYVPIAMNTPSESDTYFGIYGIAEITLGYMFIITTSDSAEQG